MAKGDIGNKRITQTFLSGKLSVTIVIPIDIARRKGIDKPCYVTVEEKPEGILLKKVNI